MPPWPPTTTKLRGNRTVPKYRARCPLCGRMRFMVPDLMDSTFDPPLQSFFRLANSCQQYESVHH
jgi:hypothetical protein